MMLKAKVNDRRKNLALSRDAFRGPGSDVTIDQVDHNFDLLHAEIVEVEIEKVSPSIVPSGNFAELNRTVTCMVLKANDRRTPSSMSR
ncbi:hypothetical protein TNCV_2983831 [Trichonephila clavipes]|nr:hypothetical protein TNCV_2983831 [Trichonephila clavipes]